MASPVAEEKSGSGSKVGDKEATEELLHKMTTPVAGEDLETGEKSAPACEEEDKDSEKGSGTCGRGCKLTESDKDCGESLASDDHSGAELFPMVKVMRIAGPTGFTILSPAAIAGAATCFDKMDTHGFSEETCSVRCSSCAILTSRTQHFHVSQDSLHCFRRMRKPSWNFRRRRPLMLSATRKHS